MNEQLEKMITDVLTFTELATPDADEKLMDHIEGHEVKVGLGHLRRKNIFPISYIGAVEPFLEPWLDDGEDRRIYFRDATPRDVNGKWDISVITSAEESWGEDALFQLARCRRKPLSELRGQKTLSEYANETSIAVIKRNGSYVSARTTDFYVGKDANGQGRWASIEHSGFLLKKDADYGDMVRTGSRPVEDEETSKMINVALGAQFNRDYDWTVTITLSNIGNPVLLTTDSLGARQMFSDREAAASRRAALEHWVEQHWRKCRKDPDSESFVRQHLRGAEQFIWKGFECALKPSPFDFRLAEKLKAEREEMKREGKTVRLRGDHAAVAQTLPQLSTKKSKES